MEDDLERGLDSDIRVRVKYYTTLRDLAGAPEEEIALQEGALLKDLISEVIASYGQEARDYLVRDYGKEKDIDRSMYFLINGRNSETLSGMETSLHEGDTVAIIPPIGGG